MDGKSIHYEIFDGKAIKKTLADPHKFEYFATRQKIDLNTIVDHEVYYFVAYVIKTN